MAKKFGIIKSLINSLLNTGEIYPPIKPVKDSQTQVVLDPTFATVFAPMTNDDGLPKLVLVTKLNKKTKGVVPSARLTEIILI